MRIFEEIWTAVTYVTHWLTLSPVDGPDVRQYPFPGLSQVGTGVAINDDPVFTPPGAPPGSDFLCDYRNMPGWFQCSTPENRECWLRHPDGREFNIHTNYETQFPIGVDRNYTLTINDGWINADGQNFTGAKLFNNQFPGPWIEACWGDVWHRPFLLPCNISSLMHFAEGQCQSYKQSP